MAPPRPAPPVPGTTTGTTSASRCSATIGPGSVGPPEPELELEESLHAVMALQVSAVAMQISKASLYLLPLLEEEENEEDDDEDDDVPRQDVTHASNRVPLELLELELESSEPEEPELEELELDRQIAM
jgi:hypothetical protein